MNQIVLEIELVGCFLSRHSPDQFTIATDQLKKEVVTRRLHRKEKGKKMSLTDAARAFLLSRLRGRSLLKSPDLVFLCCYFIIDLTFPTLVIYSRSIIY